MNNSRYYSRHEDKHYGHSYKYRRHHDSKYNNTSRQETPPALFDVNDKLTDKVNSMIFYISSHYRQKYELQCKGLEIQQLTKENKELHEKIKKYQKKP